MKPIPDGDLGFLYARPSFLAGFISVFDWANTLDEYNMLSNPSLADEVAIRNDWAFVGKDIYSAMDKFQEERTEKKRKNEHKKEFVSPAPDRSKVTIAVSSSQRSPFSFRTNSAPRAAIEIQRGCTGWCRANPIDGRKTVSPSPKSRDKSN